MRRDSDGGHTFGLLGSQSSPLPELPDCESRRGKADEHGEKPNDSLDRETHSKSWVCARLKVGMMEWTECPRNCGWDDLEDEEGVVWAEGPDKDR